jgi:hypothetical protein
MYEAPTAEGTAYPVLQYSGSTGNIASAYFLIHNTDTGTDTGTGTDTNIMNGTATVTSIWDTDLQVGACTNTMYFTSGRHWVDRISFPPGIRGRLFQQRLISDVPCQIWSSNLELIPMMIKGATRRTISKIPGTPK